MDEDQVVDGSRGRDYGVIQESEEKRLSSNNKHISTRDEIAVSVSQLQGPRLGGAPLYEQ